MPWSLLAWILCFFLQAGLVGIVFYTLIQLYDFEEDLLNNSDCAKRCNRFVVRSRSSHISHCTAALGAPVGKPNQDFSAISAQ